MHDAHNTGVLSDGIRNHFRGRQAIRVGFQVSHLESLALELTTGIEHRFVLYFRGDDVLAFALIEMGSAFDRQVI